MSAYALMNFAQKHKGNGGTVKFVDWLIYYDEQCLINIK